MSGFERMGSSNLVTSVANLTVKEEPDAEEFISPDVPLKKTTFDTAKAKTKNTHSKISNL